MLTHNIVLFWNILQKNTLLNLHLLVNSVTVLVVALQWQVYLAIAINIQFNIFIAVWFAGQTWVPQAQEATAVYLLRTVEMR
jgi:hypothetical protein